MNICNKCIHIDSLKEWISSFSSKGNCNVCQSNQQFIVEWKKFLDHIENLINQLYTEKPNGNLVIRDVIEYMEFQAHTDIKTMLIRELQNKKYSRKVDADTNSNPSMIFPLTVLWKGFKLIIKYKCRFFCKEYIMDNYHKPEKAEMFFNKFKGLIDEFREEILVSLDKNNIIYRARDNNNEKITAKNYQTLGAPNPEQKIYPTRTSPVGIPVFYSSTDKSTAIAEIKTTSKKFIVGKWRLNQKCFFIDISSYGNDYMLPDFWSIKNLRKRDFIQFLNLLNNDFSKRIVKDKKSHIEYLPTQLISEFFKINYSDVCGIIYKSTVSNKKNIAIFNERFQYSDINKYNDTENKDTKTLILEDCTDERYFC